MGYKLCANFVKVAQGIRPCGAFIFHILAKSEQKCQFLGSYTHVVAPVQRIAPGAKNLKIGLSKLNTGGLC